MGETSTSTTLVGRTVPRNRNELLSTFILLCPRWGMLRDVGTLGRDAAVTSVIRIIGLTAIAPQFAGIVIAGLGKTAREGG